MKTLMITDQLEDMGVDLNDVNFGKFDALGDITARRTRNPQSEGFKKHGAFYRANYERGILIYYLIRELASGSEEFSMLEIGFGRGYASACALMSMEDHGIEGRVTTVDPVINQGQLTAISSMVPSVMSKLHCLQGTSRQAFESGMLEAKSFDFSYVDGDHSEEGVKYDRDHVLPITKKMILFDDYHLDDQEEHIQCRKPIDEITADKRLIIMDRRLFPDERGLKDEEIRYGQVLVSL